MLMNDDAPGVDVIGEVDIVVVVASRVIVPYEVAAVECIKLCWWWHT